LSEKRQAYDEAQLLSYGGAVPPGKEMLFEDFHEWITTVS
jgi:hypothetical protein